MKQAAFKYNYFIIYPIITFYMFIIQIEVLRPPRIKVEYHANENPLKYSEKNSICWSKVNVTNNQQITIPYNASWVLLNAIKF